MILLISMTIIVFCSAVATASTSEQRDRLTLILKRVASAAGSNHVRPTLHIEESPGIAHFDMEDRSITVDPRLIKLADASSTHGDKLLAYIIGHEYAHYVRGHEFNRKFHHTFGAMLADAGERPGLSEMLSASRKDEFEADYYGLYYCYIAGYRYSANEIRKFMDAIKDEFQTGDISYTHPAWSQRKLVVDTVLVEFERLALTFHSGNALLLSGRYEQATVLYEWISSTVPLPEVQWNEVVSRILHIQEVSNKRVVNPDQLLQRVNLAPIFRDGASKAPSTEDVAALLDKCESVIDVLTARRYNTERCQSAMQILGVLRDVYTCNNCNNRSLCSQHKDAASGIKLENSVAQSAAANQQMTDQQIRAKTSVTERRFTQLRKSLPSNSIPTKNGEINLSTNQETSTSESHLIMTNVEGSRTAITIVAEDCTDCTARSPVFYGNSLFIAAEGQRIYAVVTQAD